jgi:protein-tyrosine-phosphatase
MCRLIIALSVSTICLVGVLAASTNNHPQDHSAKSPQPPTVLFICPHGAAKSVLASAYFQRAAKERGLNVRVMSAGTDPDAQISTAVASHLAKNGYDVPSVQPRQVTAEDMAAADVVISIGCDLKDLPAPREALVQWDDVPSTSEEFARADERIRERVAQLIEELVRKQQQQQQQQQ